MKVLTFNVQHCASYLNGGVIDIPLVAQAIRGYDADVVGLNEMYGKGTKPQFTAQVEELAKLADYPAHYFAKAIDFKGNNPYGNGFLSRIKIAHAEVIPIPDPDPRGYDGYYETRCLFKAELENGVTVLVTHFGLNPDEHQNAVDTILPHLKSEKCILMGDFNVTPDNPVLAPIYARMKDTAEAFAEPKLSWPSDVPTKKIDYIFVSPDAKVISADIPADMTSDHRPYITEIVFD
jgi:endonuclease/exonuclease/phosphatase family metal-dependent hydrolase